MAFLMVKRMKTFLSKEPVYSGLIFAVRAATISTIFPHSLLQGFHDFRQFLLRHRLATAVFESSEEVEYSKGPAAYFLGNGTSVNLWSIYTSVEKPTPYPRFSLGSLHFIHSKILSYWYITLSFHTPSPSLVHTPASFYSITSFTQLLIWLLSPFPSLLNSPLLPTVAGAVRPVEIS